MKMIKKAAVIICGIMMMCPITAYAAVDADAKAVYEEVIEKTKDMTDMNAYYDMKLGVSDGTQNENMRMEMNVKMKNITDPQNIQYMVYSRTNAGGTELIMSQYYKDGYSYMDMLGSKVKAQMPLADMMNQVMTSANALNTSTEYFDSLTLRTEGENRILSYTMNDEKLNDYVQQIMGMMGSMDSLVGGMQMSAREVSGEYIVNKEGYYTKAFIKMTLDMSLMGQNISITMDGDIGIADPGQPVEIIMPDFSEYQEVTADKPAA